MALFALGGACAQTASDEVFETGLAQYLAHEFASAEDTFRSILADPSAHDSVNVERAHFYVLKCLHGRGEFSAFEDELAALQARDPQSPAIDDAIFLYATFCYEKGEFQSAAALCELFAADERLIQSPYGERAAYLALRAYHRGNDALLFNEAFSRFIQHFPTSPNRSGADSLRIKVALDLEHRPLNAIALCEQFLSDHLQSSLLPDVRIDLIHSLEWANRWEEFFAETAAVAQEFADSHPRHAARALVEEGLWRALLHSDESAARNLFERAASNFPDTSAGEEGARWIRALSNPESVENIDYHWELALRARHIWRNRLESVRAHRAIAIAGRSRQFSQFLADVTVSAEVRAERLHRVSFAEHTTGHHVEAWQVAQRIMEEFPATRHARIHAPAIQAMCLVRAHDYPGARGRLQQIADDLQPGDPEAGHVLRQLARTCLALGDSEAEIAAWVTLQERFPDDRLKGVARDRLDVVLRHRAEMGDVIDAVRSDLQVLRGSDQRARLSLYSLRASLVASAAASEHERDLIALAGTDRDRAEPDDSALSLAWSELGS